ncbi:LysM peptidoglycan-binding domain-containing protein [Flaviflagellibacter deserti]|uniref:LysM peptidoglycan-binding domain-containing protein n=1 Tax=Flaviflagellibacter deserti TaxID=2267266 RepID=A0ABV9Z0A6_9HYPH
MNARARQILALGLIVILAIGIGVVARREVQRQDTAALSQSAPQVVTPGTPSTPPSDTASKNAADGKTAATIVPSFDIVRVEPRGDAIIAGRAAPGAEVELLSNGGVIDRTKANEAGEFVMMPPTFAQGSYELTLRTPDAGGSKQSVTVAIPEPGKGEVLVVVGEPGKPSQVVQAGSPATHTATVGSPAIPSPAVITPPVAPQTAEAAPELPLRIGAVEAEGGKLFVQGTGPEGARAQIYLNDSPLAEATVGDDGKWSLKIEKGVAAGNYKVRVDQLGESGKVVARAEVPFAALKAMPPADAPKPSELASSSTNPADAPSTTGAVQSANPIVTKLDTLEVQRGDNLWRISRKIYGAGVRYSTIYEANADQIRDPNRIYPGQIFVMPPKG